MNIEVTIVDEKYRSYVAKCDGFKGSHIGEPKEAIYMAIGKLFQAMAAAGKTLPFDLNLSQEVQASLFGK